MGLGTNLRNARKTKGLTQKALAKAIESDPSYINRIEAEKVNPSVAVLERIAQVLESSLDQLVKGNGNGIDVHVADQGLADRIRLIDQLEDDDRNALLQVIDTMLTKKRMRDLLQEPSR